MTRAWSRWIGPGICWMALAAAVCARAEDHPNYPQNRPKRTKPVPAESAYRVHPDRPRQVIRGFGFEIQSDSIGSANKGLPDAPTSVPHDLVPAERQRFFTEMLRGFRYCRLAGGLYWRGTDAEGRYLQPRWPEQLNEIREMLRVAGIEGVSFEYWSPAPYWKANRSYVGPVKETNLLRCYGPDFANDPEYHGDTNRFLSDFAQAMCRDILTLKSNGIPVLKWGLQNEPRAWNHGPDYSRCGYTRDQYVTAWRAVAPAIRALDPSIQIITDSWKLKYVEPLYDDPATRPLIDALVLHHVGSDANVIRETVRAARQRFGTNLPLYQNEYEYLWGPTTPDRCMNTVLHVMNWFQQGDAPTWYWIHALKPIGNAEASGYSLGFWRPALDTNRADHPKFPGLKPGHWTWNPYNWHAVGSFVKRMPWDCRSVTVEESTPDPDLRILAFKRPNGKLTIVLANRSGAEHTFRVNTGLSGATFKGFRFKPDDAGKNFQGVPFGTTSGGTIQPRVADRTWEFWEQQ
jgi:hypothetical protein